MWLNQPNSKWTNEEWQNLNSKDQKPKVRYLTGRIQKGQMLEDGTNLKRSRKV